MLTGTISDGYRHKNNTAPHHDVRSFLFRCLWLTSKPTGSLSFVFTHPQEDLKKKSKPTRQKCTLIKDELRRLWMSTCSVFFPVYPPERTPLVPSAACSAAISASLSPLARVDEDSERCSYLVKASCMQETRRGRWTYQHKQARRAHGPRTTQPEALAFMRS